MSASSLGEMGSKHVMNLVGLGLRGWADVESDDEECPWQTHQTQLLGIEWSTSLSLRTGSTSESELRSKACQESPPERTTESSTKPAEEESDEALVLFCLFCSLSLFVSCCLFCLFSLLGVGLLEFKLNSSPRLVYFSSPGLLPTPECPWSGRVSNPRLSLECPTPKCRWSAQP